ncbi:hypothetical protein E3N88_29382 [Mikania micrantha]|uniref:Replication factor A C-terminal domain-containing protein n=1 Tax=Mikania micrantha TaxID=192012 RepID=A0A5N6MJJ1_9ASTR|nr:hypothetical protein E3N88_29382 [Mikania micrantha]
MEMPLRLLQTWTMRHTLTPSLWFRNATLFSVPSRTHMPSVQHESSLRIVKTTSFTPLFGKELPTYYYKFASYNDLESRMEMPKLLTDITLWGEKATEIRSEGSIGQLLAISSAMVTQFQGNLQLESTVGTAAIINPPIVDIQSYIQRFRDLGGSTQQQPDDIPVTIRELKSRNVNGILLLYFQCYVLITEIQPNRTWYYVKCSECTKRVYPQQNEFVCEDDGLISEPRFMFCLNTIVAHDTGTTNVVFFNDALSQLLKTTCKELVVSQNNRNPRIIPKEIASIVNVPLVIHFNMKKYGYLAVNKVETTRLPPATPDPKIGSTRRADQ